MTVKELKEALKDVDEKLKVILEGCDCFGSWNGKIEEGETDITLCRD